MAGVKQGFNVPVGQSAAVENALGAPRGRAGDVVNEVDSKLLTDTEGRERDAMAQRLLSSSHRPPSAGDRTNLERGQACEVGCRGKETEIGVDS